MEETYSAHGIRFRYPSEWDVDEQDDEEQVSITVSSPGTSFWVLNLYFDRPAPDDLVEAALDAFREEYEELDIYPSRAKLCKRKTVARDIDFVCLELLNSAYVRAFRTDRFSVLVLYQGTGRELDETGPIFEKMTRSLACA